MSFKKFLSTALFVLLTFASLSLSAQELFIFDENAKCTFDGQRINRLIKNDSLYEATTLLNEALTFTKKYGFKKFEAKAYNHLGLVFSEMGHHKTAENYYYKAFNIYDSIKNFRGRDHVLYNLTSTYLENTEDKKFEKIYRKAIASSIALGSELYFLNLENQIKRYYYSNKNDSLLAYSNFALKKLNEYNFDNINFSRDFRISNLKNKQKQIYQYHKAIALIKLDKFEEGFKLLMSIDSNEFESAVSSKKNFNRQLATFNYYKFRFFNEMLQQSDSAVAYLLKSDTYKYQALRNYENNVVKNGDLIYKIIQTEEKLKSATEIMEKDEKLSNSFIASSIISFILLFVVIVFCVYYYRR